jgi:hypothetical protein
MFYILVYWVWKKRDSLEIKKEQECFVDHILATKRLVLMWINSSSRERFNIDSISLEHVVKSKSWIEKLFGFNWILVF